MDVVKLKKGEKERRVWRCCGKKSANKRLVRTSGTRRNFSIIARYTRAVALQAVYFRSGRPQCRTTEALANSFVPTAYTKNNVFEVFVEHAVPVFSTSFRNSTAMRGYHAHHATRKRRICRKNQVHGGIVFHVLRHTSLPDSQSSCLMYGMLSLEFPVHRAEILSLARMSRTVHPIFP